MAKDYWPVWIGKECWSCFRDLYPSLERASAESFATLPKPYPTHEGHYNLEFFQIKMKISVFFRKDVVLIS